MEVKWKSGGPQEAGAHITSLSLCLFCQFYVCVCSVSFVDSHPGLVKVTLYSDRTYVSFSSYLIADVKNTMFRILLHCPRALLFSLLLLTRSFKND